MEMHDPSSQTTLLIILGASDWPLSPGLSRSEAFVYAAGGLKKYFLDHDQFGIAPENVLDLFNVNDSPDDLDKQISRFLERRLAAMKADGNAARDLICYFVGHGGFEGRDSAFYLAVRRTRMENLYASGIPMVSLAKTLTEKARPLRRIIILDCCFAAAAFSAFQAGPAEVALKKTVDAFEVREKNRVFPLKGTALLCSSDHAIPSRILPDDSSTMFTNALLNVLTKGTSSQQKYLSLREVTELASDFLSETENAPMPALHSPDQREGDIADMPFFPNPCAQEKQAAQKEQQSTSVRTPPFSQSKFWYRMSRSRAVLLLSVLIVILVSFSLIGVTKAPRSPVNTMPPPSSREHPTLTSTYQPTSTPTIGQHPTITSDTKSNSSPTSTTISSQNVLAQKRSVIVSNATQGVADIEGAQYVAKQDTIYFVERSQCLSELVHVKGGHPIYYSCIGSGYDKPQSVYVTNDGSTAYISERGSGHIISVSLSGPHQGQVTLIASGLNWPQQIVVDEAGGFLYTVENANPGRLVRIDLRHDYVQETLQDNLQNGIGLQMSPNFQTAYVTEWTRGSRQGFLVHYDLNTHKKDVLLQTQLNSSNAYAYLNELHWANSEDTALLTTEYAATNKVWYIDLKQKLLQFQLVSAKVSSPVSAISVSHTRLFPIFVFCFTEIDELS